MILNLSQVKIKNLVLKLEIQSVYRGVNVALVFIYFSTLS